MILAPAVGTYDATLNFESENLIKENIQVELKNLGYEQVDLAVGKEANLATFETLVSHGERYGLVLINAHGAKNGALQTGELISFCKNVNCSVSSKIKEGLDAKIYGYGGVYNTDDKSYYLTILPKWWETKNIAGIKDSASRFYFFASCSAFAEFEDKDKKIPNKLRTYFQENKLNVIGFNNLSRNNTPLGYIWISGRNYKQHGLEFYLDILKDQQNKSISVFESISKLKPNAGDICLDEYSVFFRTDKWGSITSPLIPSVAASECVVSAGNFNLYLSPNACSSSTTTPIPQSGAPVISNFVVPTSGKANQFFDVQVAYSDPNGNNDVVKAIFTADDDYPKLHSYSITNGNGIYSTSFAFDSAGAHWLNVYVVDNAGNKSNEIKKNITITADSTNTTSISGTYNGTKTYTTGVEAGKTYSISLSSLTNQVTGTYVVNYMPSSIDNGKISGNTISFTTNPYFNPSCTHSFTGAVSGNVISGSFVTSNNCNGSGTWRVTK